MCMGVISIMVLCVTCVSVAALVMIVSLPSNGNPDENAETGKVIYTTSI